MKLITYDAGSGARLGALVDDQVIDLNQASRGDLPADMRSFLELGAAGMNMARSVVDRASSAGQTIPVGSVKLLAPISNPSKVVAIGLNYWDHCREQNLEAPKAPVIFTKFTTSIIGPGDVVRWDPALTSKVDYEVELAVVIGRPTRLVAADEALDYVAGYTICNDVSARELQQGDGQWVRAKSLDTFCPLGPCLVTKDEIPDPQNLALRCTVNGDVRQESNTNEMIFPVRELIEYTSRAFTLLPGDIITTGTPDGVGVFRSPPIFLKGGDEMVIEIEGIGQLSNKCAEV